ncbi:helix-turn-helix domain-containing protein [Deinococcus ficus]|uniref:helix-turn-helix domain-containing protein n=1 Tax=Deinococcus ficus TaxID=317577 RepID=UPI00174DAD5A|nr:helix-turn-helix transcriptional regulator [Deinococcus ficus]
MVEWQLREYLDAHGLSVYSLVKATGGALSTTGVYNLSRGTKQVKLETLDLIITALREMTGHDVTVGDVLRYTPHAAAPGAGEG